MFILILLTHKILSKEKSVKTKIYNKKQNLLIK